VDFERVSSISQIMNIHASMEFDGLGPRRCVFPAALPCFLFNFVLGGVIHLWVLFRIVCTKLVE
jgi:hypothetical protein